MAFEASVESPRWFLAPGAGSLLLRDEESRGGGGLIAGPVLLAVAALLAAIVRVFGALRVRFGPLGPTLHAAEITGARVEPYRWLAYGGRGARLGWQGGRWSHSCSASFVRSGVVIDTRRRYHVTSRRPADLAQAVGRLVAETEGS